jgi:hypothetical protein
MTLPGFSIAAQKPAEIGVQVVGRGRTYAFAA